MLPERGHIVTDLDMNQTGWWHSGGKVGGECRASWVDFVWKTSYMLRYANSTTIVVGHIIQ